MTTSSGMTCASNRRLGTIASKTAFTHEESDLYRRADGDANREIELVLDGNSDGRDVLGGVANYALRHRPTALAGPAETHRWAAR